MDAEGEWLGVGLYTAAEGARLLDLPAARLRRWLGGYRATGREHPRLRLLQCLSGTPVRQMTA